MGAGGIMSTLEKHGRDFVHLYKNGQGGFCPGGFCPAPFFRHRHFYECWTKSLPDKIPSAHFCISGHNPSHVFCTVGIIPPTLFYKVDKIPSVNFPTRTKPLPAEITYISKLNREIRNPKQQKSNYQKLK